VIDDEYIAKLKVRQASAPLHIPIMLREIHNAHYHFPNVRLIAASDSAFHRDMPPRARNYSIAAKDAEELDLYRFGYHGLSVSSVVGRIHAVVGASPERMIVCHIGNGTSVTAVKKGKSVETTMGFAPATGVIMGSRAGDIDSAALLELMKAKNYRPADAELYINTNGGLQGLAGNADIRMLLERRSQGDLIAAQTLDMFSYHLQKAIAAQTVALGGLDVLVLTATASVRSSALRGLVTANLRHLGIHISQDRNELMVGKDGIISVRNSPVKVVVMRTDEMAEMAGVVAEVGRRFHQTEKEK
jgi:acetate kinase